ncbi:hypothetical protein V8F06_004902 [Rhypophila decipiens]
MCAGRRVWSAPAVVGFKIGANITMSSFPGRLKVNIAEVAIQVLVRWFGWPAFLIVRSAHKNIHLRRIKILLSRLSPRYMSSANENIHIQDQMIVLASYEHCGYGNKDEYYPTPGFGYFGWWGSVTYMISLPSLQQPGSGLTMSTPSVSVPPTKSFARFMSAIIIMQSDLQANPPINVTLNVPATRLSSPPIESLGRAEWFVTSHCCQSSKSALDGPHAKDELLEMLDAERYPPRLGRGHEEDNERQRVPDQAWRQAATAPRHNPLRHRVQGYRVSLQIAEFLATTALWAIFTKIKFQTTRAKRYERLLKAHSPGFCGATGGGLLVLQLQLQLPRAPRKYIVQKYQALVKGVLRLNRPVEFTGSQHIW